MQKEISGLAQTNERLEIELMQKNEELQQLLESKDQLVPAEDLEKLQNDLRSEREKSITARHSLTEIEQAHEALKQELESRMNQMISSDEATRLQAEANRLKIFNSSLQEEIATLKSQIEKLKSDPLTEIEAPKPIEYSTSTSTVGEVEESGQSYGEIHPDLDFLDQVGIKRVTADQKDDLKLISGVGPFIEQKLNHLGIYSFEQIASLSSTQIDQITDAIEFFPGRIKRDDWVGQARGFIS